MLAVSLQNPTNIEMNENIENKSIRSSITHNLNETRQVTDIVRMTASIIILIYISLL